MSRFLFGVLALAFFCLPMHNTAPPNAVTTQHETLMTNVILDNAGPTGVVATPESIILDVAEPKGPNPEARLSTTGLIVTVTIYLCREGLQGAMRPEQADTFGKADQSAVT